MVNKFQVFVLHEKFPLLSASDIGELLGCDSGWVRATARRNGLDLPKGNVRTSMEVTLDRATQFIEAQTYVDTMDFGVDVEEIRAAPAEEQAAE